MAGILGLGATHSPLLVGNDARMAGIFERLLQNPRVPPSSTNPANWPMAMQQEWAAHQAGEAPAAHRKRAMEGFRAVRAALDAFNPDFLLIFGDDQYENFREDGVAPFCVFALDAIEFASLPPHWCGKCLGRTAGYRRAAHRTSRRRPLSCALTDRTGVRHQLRLHDATRSRAAARIHQCAAAARQ